MANGLVRHSIYIAVAREIHIELHCAKRDIKTCFVGLKTMHVRVLLHMLSALGQFDWPNRGG